MKRLSLLFSLFVLCFVLINSKTSKAAVFEEGNVILKLNNSFLVYSQQEMPQINNGHVFIPIRMIGDLMGTNVIWNNMSKSIIIQDDDKTIKMSLNEKAVTVNNDEIILETPPFFKNNTVFVPLRFLTEVMNINVNYYEDKRVVEVQSEKFLNTETVSIIDEMMNKDEAYEGMIVPLSVKTKQEKHGNTLLIEVQNYSETTINKYELHRNIIFFRSETSVAFAGSKGENYHQSTPGYNKVEIGANGRITDEIPLVKDIQGDRLGNYKYILSNYFKIK
ncbi:stalk domain-containing protein [Paenibacillus bouchesdurhonensis]|uniref:stalk domain-containing protein n=1 Tax=Paenibacillus bouchesdurhonensis TaxID=1870990 RepID=UPI000DA60E01|nr:stalk domain-containing protein [Paenibacillus bouchesdurhonensis]